MPKPAPRIPAKPIGLKTVQPTPAAPRSGPGPSARYGTRGPRPQPRPNPRVRVRGGVGDDNDNEPQENENPGKDKKKKKDDSSSSSDSSSETSSNNSGDDENNDGDDQEDGSQGEETPEDREAKAKARRKANRHPQKTINKLWKNYEPVYLGRVTKILPESVPASTIPKGKVEVSQNASESYEQARAQCVKDVQRIVNECRALNQKYTDVHFDIEQDLKVTRKRDCLDGLVLDNEDRYFPEDVKRVTDLFQKPTFYSEGADSDDIMQGAIGDCWMMSAFSVLTCREEMIHRVCVVQDQEVGVYGFVFFRDGEWHQTIIDDKLYLNRGAFDEGIETVLSGWGKEQETKYNELFQQGSKALYFARCRDDNETWVPLLEKALAKAHGGYDALSGGQTGEALEDLTGGVTTELYTTNILSRDRFWSEELIKIGKDFMFDATDAVYREWKGWDEEISFVKKYRDKARKGVVDRHAYAVLDTYEGHGQRLVKVRNPWGQSEWSGPWSDGSSEWTAEWLQRLEHKFGDDGIFWMSYADFLKNYKHLNRTRIFDNSWYTAQKWATIQVPFSTLDYQAKKFEIDVPEDTATVIVLSQLDDRYFQGLQGKYEFYLQFRVAPADNEDEYICRSKHNYELTRSTNVELQLAKGKYVVLIKIEAYDRSCWGWKTPDEIIKDNLPGRKEKVITIGRLYDLAHRKGLPEVEDEVPKGLEPAATHSATQTTDNGTGIDGPVITPDTTAESTTAPTTSDKEPMSVEAMAAVVAAAISPDSDDSDSGSGSGSGSGSDTDSDSDDEDEKQPWNASCVVGLRVYSRQPELSVRVILPPKPKVEKPTTPALDRDDITKSAQDKAEDEEQKGKEDQKKGKDDKKKDKGKESKDSKEEKGKKDEKEKKQDKTKKGLPVRGKTKPPPVEEEEDEEEEEEDEESSE